MAVALIGTMDQLSNRYSLVAAAAPMAKMKGWVHYWDDPDHVTQLYIGVAIAVGLLLFFVVYAKVATKKPKS